MSDAARLESLTRRVADEVDGRISDERRAGQRRVIVGLMTGPRRAPRRSWRWLPSLVAAGAIATLAVLVATGSQPFGARETRFWVDAETAPQRPGAFLRAPEQRALKVQFDSGARLDLTAGSAARVSAASRTQVRITLLHGEARSAVLGQAPGSWTIEAGPYNVTTLGTVFAVRWDASRLALLVGVTRGQVRVEGAGLDPRGLQVAAGQQLRVERDGAVVGRTALGSALAATATAALPPSARAPAEPSPSPSPVRAAPRAAAPQPAAGERPAAPAEPRAAAAAERDDPAPAATPSASQPASAPTRPLPAWRQAHVRGDYRRAVAEAERQGLTELLRLLPADELRQLADAARYTGKGPLARRALLALRGRFPGTGHARIAAFLLGRTHDELLRDHAAAARWFETYLREEPAGALAEEALGRRVDAYRRAGDAAAARAAAREYLQRHPGGVFAPVARDALR